MVIYKAENKINGYIYIGKATIFRKRKGRHKIDALKYNSQTHFHRAIRKYGWENFEWSIICETDSEYKLKAIEKFYIAAYRKMTKCYNMTDGGEGLSGWNHSDVSRKKISEKTKGRTVSLEQRKILSELYKGKKLSDERIEKLKGRTPWNKGLNLTEEHKNKLSENHADFKGEKSSLHGKPLSEEHKKKISVSRKGKLTGSNNHMFGVSLCGEKNGFFGKHHTEETRKKMSEAKRRKNA